MKVYSTKNLRNLVLMGHAGSGKTTFSESMLLLGGQITRRGTVEEKNTVSDNYEFEQERGCSILSSPMFIEWKDTKFNIIDTPGYDDYIGEMIAAIRVADTGVLFVNAQGGVEVGTENAWNAAKNENKPVLFVLNKLDNEHLDVDKSIADLKDYYGSTVAFVQYPENPGSGFNKIVDVLTGKAYEFAPDGSTKDSTIGDQAKFDQYRGELMEAIAETDEDLMTKYFDAGELTSEEMISGFKKAFINRQIFPVLSAAGKSGIGVGSLLQFVLDNCPSPDEAVPFKNVDGEAIEVSASAPISLFVYKLTSEARTGDMSYFRVVTGTMKTGVDLVNEQKNTVERFNQIFIINGKKRVEVDGLSAGDLGAAVKLKSAQISCTLHEKGSNAILPAIKYPNPKVRIAIVPKEKGEEEKVGMALNAMHNEDPTIIINHSQELRQTILNAQGDLHLTAIKWKLSNRYKVEVEFIAPRVPYRETIQKQVRGSYRHKKQSGGSGQFAEVHMLIEPWSEDMPNPSGVTVRGKELIDLDWGGKLEYMNCIVGGVIDARFMPAILKGVMEKMQVGPLTGSYVRDIRVAIYDGKMHPVDSNEAAFKTASMNVFKDNFTKASPKLLEPIYLVDIKVPEDYVGAVMSDLPSRRGVILGIDTEGRYQIVKSRMPLAELDKYATALRAMTQGSATYASEFAEYQTVPGDVQQKLVEAYQKTLTEDE